MIEKLKSLGLTKGEAKAYLALLKIGSSTVGPIVRESGVAYSNIYDVLDRLIKKGLANFIVKEKTKYFQAASLENLEKILEEQENEIKLKKQRLSKLKDELIKVSSEIKQDAEIFLGKRGLKSAYSSMIEDSKKGDEFLFLFVLDEKYNEEANEFYLDILKIFKKNKIKIKGVSNKKYKNLKSTRELEKEIKIKYTESQIPINIDIFKDKILIVSWNPLMGFLIKSKEISNKFKKYFYSL